MTATDQSRPSTTTTPVISVRGAGIRFKRNRRASRSFKDLFAGSSRRKRADEFWALRGVSFDVRPGEAPAERPRWVGAAADQPHDAVTDPTPL